MSPEDWDLGCEYMWIAITLENKLLDDRELDSFFLLNEAPIYWMPKKQTPCETSTFGSEFVAMKQAVEYV